MCSICGGSDRNCPCCGQDEYNEEDEYDYMAEDEDMDKYYEKKYGKN